MERKKKLVAISIITVIMMLVVGLAGCTEEGSNVHSDSGVLQASVEVPVGADGYTAEQRNIRDRLLEDNKIGAIKHFYLFSAYSGQCLLYSTVDGKVTSSGKRLNPTTVEVGEWLPDNDVYIGSQSRETREVLQDDGSYGTSIDYLYWWDVRGVYHQHYISGGQIIHVSNQPLDITDIIINLELFEE